MSAVGIALDALILSAIIGNIARLGLFAWRVFEGVLAHGVELRPLHTNGSVGDLGCLARQQSRPHSSPHLHGEAGDWR